MNPFRVLVRHRNFRLFWLGQTLSLVGTWMQIMAQGWLALELTDDAFLVGVVSAIGSLPILLFSFAAGVYVDRSDRLRVVRAMQTLLLVEAATLWALTATGHITIGALIALAFLNGAFSAVEIPARQSLMIELVGREDLQAAIALNSSGFNLARIVGPGLGAAVIASLGLAWCFGLNALSYLAVLAGLLVIRLPPRARTESHAPALEGLREGFRYMWHTREVRTLMGITLVSAVCGTPYLTLMPVFARDLLGLGADGYGWLLAAVGIGGLAGALVLAAAGARVSRRRLLQGATYGFGALLAALGTVRHAGAAWGILFATGFTMILGGALANGILQSIVPDALRGRLMAAYSFAVVGVAQVLGSFLGGAAASAFGVSWAVGGGGAILLGYALWAFRAPAVRSLS